MLSNIIDGSDGTDHFDGVISIQVIEICQLILSPDLKVGCEAWFEKEFKFGLDFTVGKD